MWREVDLLLGCVAADNGGASFSTSVDLMKKLHACLPARTRIFHFACGRLGLKTVLPARFGDRSS